MKSICIKTNNLENINYLLNLLDNIKQDNVCFSCNNFKLFNNVIVHYTGNDEELFLSNICEILSYLVIDRYEEIILKRLIFTNYFYFDHSERKLVLDICFELLAENDKPSLDSRQSLLFNNFYKYILFENNKIVLDGFINFRLKSYVSFLNSIVDTAVNKFIVEREYIEFISLLKLYINSQDSTSECVHLIYCDMQSVLLDENKNIIKVDKDIFNAKYLSDISFSSNDFSLNALLNILPKKIYVHLIDKSIDEFINTLQLVFENRVEICNECAICRLYANSKTIKK